jgi:hypothetical protein
MTSVPIFSNVTLDNFNLIAHILIYSAFTDKLECNCHRTSFSAPLIKKVS